jgi:hypothetical protein
MRWLMVACCAIAMILLTFTFSAMALTGTQIKVLADYYEKFPESATAGAFSGYVWGVTDVFSTLYCSPNGVTNKQVVDVVAKYMKDHPEELNLSGPEIVLRAVYKAWPCK